ncbi:hypothetical protein HQ403_00950 [Candidatus Kaiserbacteria bacterium]|nr:hypothetical protein [Candidatus Kaiserbacteria bacterium]
MTTQRKILILVIMLFVFIVGALFFVYQSFIKEGGVSASRDITTEGNKGGGTLFPGSGLSSEEKNTNTRTEGPLSTLRQVSSTPTAGGTVFNVDGNTIIRYVERATGHIFETTDKSAEQNRISNTTIPRVQDSVWSQNGSMVILQYLDENEILKSFYGNILKDTGTLEGWFLSNNISSIDVNSEGSIFYIQKVGNTASGIISNFDGTNAKSVFSSSINDWRPQWMGNLTTVTTNPSRDNLGFMYVLRSGTYEKIISFEGMNTLSSPDGSHVLFSISNSNETNLFIYSRDNKEFAEVPFRTLAEKCTWADNIVIFCGSPHNSSIDGIIPDDWYKGSVSFSDDVWTYNTETQTAQLVYDIGEDGKQIDAVNLTIDHEKSTLLFMNKADLTLWALSLK